MKVWIADYSWRGGYGAYEEKSYVVTAETKEVALGLVLEAELETTAELWNITEVNTSVAEAQFIHSRSS